MDEQGGREKIGGPARRKTSRDEFAVDGLGGVYALAGGYAGPLALLASHDDGVMGHGEFNRTTLRRLLQTGEGWERATYGMEYCASPSSTCTGSCCGEVSTARGASS